MILLALRHPGTAFNDHVLQALQKRRLFPLEGFEDMLGEGARARAHFNDGEGSGRGDGAGHLRELSGNSLCEDRVDFRAGPVIPPRANARFQIVVAEFRVVERRFHKIGESYWPFPFDACDQLLSKLRVSEPGCSHSVI